jgi:hypothetical protein
MYLLEESDCAIVPMKLPNKEANASAEAAEGRARTKENDVQHHTYPRFVVGRDWNFAGSGIETAHPAGLTVG